MTKLQYYDEDWDAIRDVFTAWWRREMPPRPALSVIAPRDRLIDCPAPSRPAYADHRAGWLDAEFQIASFEAGAAKMYHGGMAAA